MHRIEFGIYIVELKRIHSKLELIESIFEVIESIFEFIEHTLDRCSVQPLVYSNKLGSGGVEVIAGILRSSGA